jgi:MoaA/NifB/PqqE/SkfB family radical SAM enzyme
VLQAALEDARSAGYSAISLSGGEPLLYTGLASLLRAARQLRYAVALTTNGIPLTVRCIAGLVGHVDLIAISLDGIGSSHDVMRGLAGAFAAVQRRLPGLRASGIPFGFIFTLTDDNLDELFRVADFAISEGAQLLQIHPLEEVGRATALLPGKRPGELTANACYLAYMRLLDQVGDRIEIQLDFAHRELIKHEPWRVYADEHRPIPVNAPLADLIDTLVIEADGTVVPLQYGFPREYSLGNLLKDRLSNLAASWCCQTYAGFLQHCRRTFERVVADEEALPAFNWFEEVAIANI